MTSRSDYPPLNEIFTADYGAKTLTWLPGVPQFVTREVYSACRDHFDLLDQMDDPIPMRFEGTILSENFNREGHAVITTEERLTMLNGWRLVSG